MKDFCLAGRIQQGARIAFRLTGAKNRVARNQQLRASLDDGRDRIVSHSAVHFNFKLQAQFAAYGRPGGGSYRGKRG